MIVSLDELPVAAPRGSATEDRQVKKQQPLLPEPEPGDNTPQQRQYALDHRSNHYLGHIRYELRVINGFPFCRAMRDDFPELYECSVEPEYVPTRLLTPHRPYSRPDRFGIARRHAGFQYPDPSHWSQLHEFDIDQVT